MKLQFGIPTLDHLLGEDLPDLLRGVGSRPGRDVIDFDAPPPPLDHEDEEGIATSYCILGPDGTGKSILALHMIARYARTVEFDAHRKLFLLIKKLKESGGGLSDEERKTVDRLVEGYENPDSYENRQLIYRIARPRLIYASTDMSYQKAKVSWENFGLHYAPRLVPFMLIPERGVEYLIPKSGSFDFDRHHLRTRLELKLLTANKDPEDSTSTTISRFISHPIEQPCVGFLDLEASTAGDDWGYVNRMLAALAPVRERDRNGPNLYRNPTSDLALEEMAIVAYSLDRNRISDGERKTKAEQLKSLIKKVVKVVHHPKPHPHLLVIDAVQGLETLAGDMDPYGVVRTRRSRVAQAIRTAKEKCHLIFVSEEVEDERLPEEFVTNVVIKLRAKQEREYSRRSLEVVKGRTTQHVRGQHFYVIRNGKGSTTGTNENPDDPKLDFEYAKTVYGVDLDRDWKATFKVESISRPDPQGYFMTYLSLTARYSDFMKDRITNVLRKDLPDRGRANFGYPFLDSLIDDGFHYGTVNALIGDEGTRKSRMARAFLSGCYVDLVNSTHTSPVVRFAPSGVAVLLSVQDLFAPRASELLAEHLIAASCENREQKVMALGRKINQRFIYRRFTIGQITATHFFFIVEHSVVRARKFLEELIDDEFEDLFREIADLTIPEGSGRLLDRAIKKLFQNVIRTAYSNRWTKQVDGSTNQAECRDFSPLRQRLTHFVEALERGSDVVDGREIHRAQIIQSLDQSLFRYVHAKKNDSSARPKAIHLLRQLQSVVRIADQQINFVVGHHRDLQQELINDEEKWNRLVWPEIDERIRRQFYYESSGRIRVVIDDWSNIYRTYPEIRGDAIFLPFLIFFLRRWNVTALIAETRNDTRGDRRKDDTVETQQQNLSMLVDFRLVTTRVNFHGKECAAVRAVPGSLAQFPIAVREIKAGNEGENSERFIIDPHFELYKGVLTGSPQRVPLKVYFYIPGGAQENAKKQQKENSSPFNAYLQNIANVFEITPEELKLACHQFVRSRHPESYPLSMKYWRQEMELLTELFKVNDDRWDHDIVPLDRLLTYAILRDFCHLRGKANLEHTLVIQVDEFWDRENDHLAYIGSYLTEKTVTDHTDSMFEDPYELFNLPAAATNPAKDNVHAKNFVSFQKLAGQPEIVTENANHQRNERIDQFELESYSFKNAGSPSLLFENRIPYYWDFGFMMCHTESWETSTSDVVQTVWRRLCRADNWKERFDQFEKKPIANSEPPVSWVQFFRACRALSNELNDKAKMKTSTFDDAKHQESDSEPIVYAFDIDVMGAETLSCCVLEIWMSELRRVRAYEIKKSKKVNQSEKTKSDLISDFLSELNEITFRGGRKCPLRFGLLEFIGGQTSGSGSFTATSKELREALFRTFLLLGEILHPKQIEEMIDQQDMTVRERAAQGRPIAARHWYSTASRIVRRDDGKTDEAYMPVRMPGSYSTRGDWDLAIAKGSQSTRLGLHAIDLISSRRANVERFRYGVGLPVRDSVPDPYRYALRSTLPAKGNPMSTADVWLYSDLRAIGGWNASEPGATQQGFHWLWRSALKDYDRHSRVFGIWIGYMLSRWREWFQKSFGGKSVNGFDIYESAFRHGVDKMEELKGRPDLSKGMFTYFNERCDYLEAALRQASRRSDSIAVSQSSSGDLVLS